MSSCLSSSVVLDAFEGDQHSAVTFRGLQLGGRLGALSKGEADHEVIAFDGVGAITCPLDKPRKADNASCFGSLDTSSV